MCFKGDSVVHFKLIYLLYFKLFTYFLNYSVFGTFFVLAAFHSRLSVFFWQSYQGIRVAQIPSFHLSKMFTGKGR